jgi:hypothetical protein
VADVGPYLAHPTRSGPSVDRDGDVSRRAACGERPAPDTRLDVDPAGTNDQCQSDDRRGGAVRARWTATISLLTAAALVCGCGSGDVLVEKSFTDRHGRACTYVLVKEAAEDDFDAGNIDCDYPPSPTGGTRP